MRIIHFALAVRIGITMTDTLRANMNRRRFLEGSSALIAAGANLRTGYAEQGEAMDSIEHNMKYDSRGPLCVSFVAGTSGRWKVDRINSVIGDGLPVAERLDMLEGAQSEPSGNRSWTLRGVTSNLRYTNQHEVAAMKKRQQGLGRPEATRAALIPIRKTNSWWTLSQDERRSIFEEQSHHIGIGIEYLPAIARRLHHSRELGEAFDFLTWFEYAPEHSDDFEELVSRLRATSEWKYVDRELDIRLSRV
jgi:hypothetical protein